MFTTVDCLSCACSVHPMCERDKMLQKSMGNVCLQKATLWKMLQVCSKPDMHRSQQSLQGPSFCRTWTVKGS